MTSVSALIPIKIVSEANVRECWQAKYSRAKEQKTAVAACLYPYGQYFRKPKGTFTITLTRIGVRKLDGDNLQRGFKSCRDSVATILGIDDGSERIEWRYEQEKGKPKEYAARIEIRAEEG